MKPVPLCPDAPCHETCISLSRCSMPWNLYLFIQMLHAMKPVPLYPDCPGHETCTSLSRCSRPWNLYLFIQMLHAIFLLLGRAALGCGLHHGWARHTGGPWRRANQQLPQILPTWKGKAVSKHTHWGVIQLSSQSAGLVIKRSQVWVPTGEFSSPGSTLCADSYFRIRTMSAMRPLERRALRYIKAINNNDASLWHELNSNHEHGLMIM